jgi:hypothetical protein
VFGVWCLVFGVWWKNHPPAWLVKIKPYLIGNHNTYDRIWRILPKNQTKHKILNTKHNKKGIHRSISPFVLLKTADRPDSS